MKKLITILAVLFMSANLYAFQWDSCKIVPNAFINSYFDNKENHDSTLVIDTCGIFEKYHLIIDTKNRIKSEIVNQIGVQDKRFYSKTGWQISSVSDLDFEMLFDTTNLDLDNTYYFTIENLKKNNLELISGLTALQNKYGKLTFYMHFFRSSSELMPLRYSIDKSKNSPAVYSINHVKCENYVNSIIFNDELTKIDGINNKFKLEIIFESSLENDKYQRKYSEISSILVDEKCNTIGIESVYKINSTTIYSMDGTPVITIENIIDNKIDVSNLLNGLYFIKFDDKIVKFLIVR